MAQGIHLRDVLRLMTATDEDGRPARFHLEVYTYNRQTGEGGRRVEYHDCTLLTERSHGPRPMSAKKRERRAAYKDRRRRPNLFELALRQIQEPHGQVRRIHVYLITKFNGLPVHA